MEKIRIYTTIGNQLKKEDENFAAEAQMISQAMGKSLGETFKLLENFLSEGKRIIHYYPALGAFDTSRYEYLCEIMDGTIYVG